MPVVISIDDLADSRLAGYRDVRERDLTGRDHFIAEGEVVLQVLLRSSLCRPVSLLVAEKRLERLLPQLIDLSDEVPVYSARQEILDSVVGFSIHRGILALGRRVETPDPDALLGDPNAAALMIVLFGISNHDNIGGIFRNAAAFGVRGILLDAHCCDPLYRKAIRVSVGGCLVVPFARLAAGADPVALLRNHGFEAIALSPHGAARLADTTRSPRTAILLGSEGPGLPQDILDRVETISIPMAGGFDSLNVATTSGIVLHHLVSAN